MVRTIIVLALLVIPWLAISGAAADKPADALSAFDSLCVSTQLDRKRFVAYAKLHKSIPIPTDQLRLMGEAELGYMVLVGETTFVASYGTKRDTDGKLSRNCTVSTTKLPLPEARKIIEANYKVRLRSHERQGLNTVTLYTVNLAGFIKKTFISIQHSSTADNTVSVSIVDF